MKAKMSPSAQYSVTMRLEYPHGSGWIAKVSSVIGKENGVISAIDFVRVHGGMSLRDYSIECSSVEHAQKIIDKVKNIEGVSVQSASDDTFLMHLGGKLEINSKVPLKTRADLSMAYTPGVARVCTAIRDDYRSSFNLTIRKNCIAVVSDGSAVLGLGDIGAAAAMPVMEGKAVLFKEFGGVDAFPLCVGSQDSEDIIHLCRLIAPGLGGINLEDISAPRCFYIEEALQRELDIPVFHDDQHGTAIVVLAGLVNALKITKRKPGKMKVVIAGAGAAGIACAKMLKEFGIKNLVVCDSKGSIHRDRRLGKNDAKHWAAEHTNPNGEKGNLKSVIRDADVFIGLSGPGVLTRGDVKKMRKEPIVFAMANPIPEVMPEDVADIVSVMATGRSDYPNQVNNVLAFPGVFRGALDARASEINAVMKRAAAEAIAAAIDDDELSPEYIIPSVFNPKVAKDVAAAVARAAHKTHVARRLRKTSIYRL
jgi:malate dehydrogenase (oxaloacetate-decarboxylating)